MAKRTVLEGMAGPVKEIVADLLGSGCQASDLAGYIVIGLKRSGFQIASNAGSDASELLILRDVVRALGSYVETQEPGTGTSCRHCHQPVKHCDDTYPAHRDRCSGWRHRDGFHRCDPRHAAGDVHAEPEAAE